MQVPKQELPLDHRRHKGDSDTVTVPAVGFNKSTASSAVNNRE